MPDSKEQEIPSVKQMQIGDLFAALADPCRRQIVRELMGEPAGARRQCSSFDVEVSKSTMTHHFRILRESGLTIQYNHGNRAELELRKADLEDRFPGLLDLLASDSEEIVTTPMTPKAVPKGAAKKRAKVELSTAKKR